MKCVHGSNPSQGDHPDARGLSVYIPMEPTSNLQEGSGFYYGETSFAVDTGWIDFLRTFAQ